MERTVLNGDRNFLQGNFRQTKFSPRGISAERNFHRTEISPNGNFAIGIFAEQNFHRIFIIIIIIIDGIDKYLAGLTTTA